MSYLIDTKVISEVRKGAQCNPHVTLAVNHLAHANLRNADRFGECILRKTQRLEEIFAQLRIPTIATTCSDASRPPVPNDRDQHGVGCKGAVRCIC